MDLCNTICDKINSNNQIFDKTKRNKKKKIRYICEYTYKYLGMHAEWYSLYTKTIFLLISANVCYIYAMHIVIHMVCIQRLYFLIAYHLQAVTYFAIFSHVCMCVRVHVREIHHICIRIIQINQNIISSVLYQSTKYIRRLKKNCFNVLLINIHFQTISRPIGTLGLFPQFERFC